MSSVSKNYGQRCLATYEKLKTCALVHEKRVDKNTTAEFEAIANGCAPVSEEETAIVSTIREIFKLSTHINKQTGVVKSIFLFPQLQHYSIATGGIVLARNLEISDVAFVMFSTEGEFCKVRAKNEKKATADVAVEQPVIKQKRKNKKVLRREEKPAPANSTETASAGVDAPQNPKNSPNTAQPQRRAYSQAPTMILGDFIQLRDDISKKVKNQKKDGDAAVPKKAETRKATKPAKSTQAASTRTAVAATEKDLSESLLGGDDNLGKSWADMAEEESAGDVKQEQQ